jgi:hypothetical protein
MKMRWRVVIVDGDPAPQLVEAGLVQVWTARHKSHFCILEFQEDEQKDKSYWEKVKVRWVQP